MADAPDLYAVVAEFDDAEALLAAVRQAREDGYARLEAFSPFPVEGLDEALGLKAPAIPRAMLIGAVLGAIGGFGLQVYTNLAYPLNVGGRPLIAPPAFALITFEMTVLGAVLCGILAMLIGNRLPRLHHPMFEIPDFHFATDDKFFLALLAGDEQFDPARARRYLKGLHPVRVADAPLTEPPR